jgi:hypothetical protein
MNQKLIEKDENFMDFHTVNDELNCIKYNNYQKDKAEKIDLRSSYQDLEMDNFNLKNEIELIRKVMIPEKFQQLFEFLTLVIEHSEKLRL